MKKIFFFIIFLSIYGCNKPKTVLICGDHVCINKAEAEQYFEQNLSLEVKLVNKNKNKKDDLIELNMKSNSVEEKKIVKRKFLVNFFFLMKKISGKIFFLMKKNSGEKKF